jgi:ubiquinone biosynthesis protein
VGILEIKREIGDLNRLRQIITILIEQGFHEHVGSAGLLKHATLRGHVKRLTTPRSETTPARVRETLEALGPTFVKLGQVLSLRPDLVPNSYCEEFKKLQDNVAPLDSKAIHQVIEAELKRPVSAIFSSFDDKPLAAASVGQVHKAVLDGKSVVVKVQRPGIRQVMERDIDIMEYLAQKVDNSEYSYLHAQKVVTEFRKYTERELDFSFELRNLRKFYEFFKDDPTIVIPKTYEEHCTSKVIVMEYIDGISFKDREAVVKAKFSPKTLVEQDIIAICRQFFELGIFHADAHPGNLLAVRKKGKQATAVLDFGIVGFLDNRLQHLIFRFLMAFYDQDTEELTSLLMEMGTTRSDCDVRSLEQSVATIMLDYSGSNLKEEKISAVVYALIDEALRKGIDISTDIILFAKALVTLEGTAAWMNPESNPIASMQPYLITYAKKQFSPAKVKKMVTANARKMQEISEGLPSLTKSLLEHVKDGSFTLKIDGQELAVAEHIYDLEASKRNLALLTGMLFIGSALFAGFASELLIFEMPIYILSLLVTAIVCIFYIRVRRRISAYIKR